MVARDARAPTCRPTLRSPTTRCPCSGRSLKPGSISWSSGGFHGSAFGTRDIDFADARDRTNLERVAAVLRRLGATFRGAPADVPFQLDAESLEEGGNFPFSTSLGSIDILAYPTGAPPYDRLRAEAAVGKIEGHEVRFASLDHLIAMKEAAGRPRDRLMASEYRMIADELRRPN